MSVEQGFRARFIRSLGFFKRELLGVVKQPRLVGTLILAPFAILLIFGLGYRTQPPPFETLLVLPGEEAALASEMDELGEAFGNGIELVGTTTDATDARSRLRSGEVDLLIIGPADPITSIEEGERAEFVVVHSEVDPLLRGSISLLAQLSIDELNNRVLEQTVSRAQSGSESIDGPLGELRSGSDELVTAIENDDSEGERLAREDLLQQVDELEERSSGSEDVYSTVSESLGTGRGDVFDTLRSRLESTQSNADGAERAREFEQAMAEFETRYRLLQETDPALLVSPFSADVRDIADLPGTPALFYGPGVLVVLLQHVAITFAALSLVRERQLGLTELFQAAPLTAGETLIGKYAAFLGVSAVIAAVLTGAMLAFGMTMRGSLLAYSLTVGLVILSSLGLGFLISRLAQTDSQAVQYAMMILLVSIFFTGLILPIEQLIPPVRVVSYLVPGTYGIVALHDVMFRGLRPSVLMLGGLVVYSIVVFVMSWFVMRRHVKGSAI